MISLERKVELVEIILDQKKNNNILLDCFSKEDMIYIRSCKEDAVSKSSFNYFINLLKELKIELRKQRLEKIMNSI